jgi:hypothetical protein
MDSDTLAPPSGPPLSASPTPAPPTPGLTPPGHAEAIIDLRTQLMAAHAQIAQLVSDNTFLRARYAELDAFASAARAELDSLREAAAIARSQATDGVELVRGTLGERVSFLEDELARARCEASVADGQTRATDDDVRSRAARVEEAEAELTRWRRRAGLAEHEVERLRETLMNSEDADYAPPDEKRQRTEAPSAIADAMYATVEVVGAAASKMDDVIAGFVASEFRKPLVLSMLTCVQTTRSKIQSDVPIIHVLTPSWTTDVFRSSRW